MYSACCLSFVKYILYFILFNSEKFALKQLYVIMHCTVHAVYLLSHTLLLQGRIQDFKLGGAHLKKLRRADGGAKIFGVFRVKIHDFTPKKQNTESPSYL